MIQTVEAIIDANGRVKLLGDVSLPRGRRALVTVLDERSDADVAETALLSEEALAEDWLRPEEEEAWSHLQSEQEFLFAFPSPTYQIPNFVRQLFWPMRSRRLDPVPDHQQTLRRHESD